MAWNPHVTSEALHLVVPRSSVLFRSEASILMQVSYSLTHGEPKVTLEQLRQLHVMTDTDNIVVSCESGTIFIDIRPPGPPRRL